VTALEADRKKKDVWDIISTLSPFVTAIVIFVATFVLKDSVDQALSKEQLHLSSVKDMEEQVLALRKTSVTKDEAEAAAMTLAAFGHYAIPSLTSVLERADDVQSPAAEEALRAIGETEPADVCRAMIYILQDPSGSYLFQVHEAALRLIAASRCTEARPVVAAYKSDLDKNTSADLSKTSARFRLNIQRDNLEELKKQAEVTLNVLTTAGT
jgi:hypothetical protein